MIYYVDEEFNRNKSKIRYLQKAGYSVRHLANAEDAWMVLYAARDIELIIVDVMLAPGKRYTRAETNNFLTTGLSLVSDLLKQREQIDPSKVLLFSAATRDDIISYIRQLSNDKGVNYSRKTDFDTPHDFVKYVLTLLR